jgi:hypothetical protein
MISFLKRRRNYVSSYRRPLLTRRPLNRAERDYLDSHKQVLDGAFQAFLLSAGMLALPFAFVLFTLGSGRGWSTERLSTALAGFIMLGLVGAVVYYSTLGRQGVKFDWAAFKQRRALRMDLDDDEAIEELRTVTGKEQKTVPGPAAEGPRRLLFVTMGDRRFQVTPMHWMAMAEGESAQIAYAPLSGIVLALDGRPDRIRLPKAPEPEPEGTAIGGG